MTNTSKNFLKKFLLEHPIEGKVLEIGSRNVNGMVKDILTNHGLKYMGLDMIDCGEFTDIVCNAHDLRDHVKEGSFDLVICLDTLEHDDRFWLTVENMRWVIKKGGWMLIVVPSLRCGPHDWPSDYYRFMMPVLKEVWFEGFNNCHFESYPPEETGPDALYGWGQK